MIAPMTIQVMNLLLVRSDRSRPKGSGRPRAADQEIEQTQIPVEPHPIAVRLAEGALIEEVGCR
jgi:hypothetical protein